MKVPRDFDLCEPTLRALRSLGGKGTVEQISEIVIHQMELPEEVSGRLWWDGPATELDYQLDWARNILETCGLATGSQIGVWVLTEKSMHHPPINIEEIKKTYQEAIRSQSDDSDESLKRVLPDSLEDELWNRLVVEQLFSRFDESDSVYDTI